MIRELLHGLRESRRAPSEMDIGLEGARLHALFDGIAVQMVTDSDKMPPELARRVLSRHLNALVASDRA